MNIINLNLEIMELNMMKFITFAENSILKIFRSIKCRMKK